VHEVAAHFPEHDAAEEDAKENQEWDVDWLKESRA